MRLKAKKKKKKKKKGASDTLTKGCFASFNGI